MGGGPAGLSAALILGRCCRSVLLCDAGTPRNWAAHEMHGFLTRDGIPPDEFRSQARQQLAPYESVELWDGEVTDITPATENSFRVQLGSGRHEFARKILIATGVVDALPRLPRIEEFWGTSVHQCPYCDGWERRGQPIAAFGRRSRGFEMARAMTAWTSDLVLCTDGHSGLTSEQAQHLARNNIEVIEDRIADLTGKNGHLEAIVYKSGRTLARRALFFDTASSPQSLLAQKLGCQFTHKGGVRCGRYDATSVPGVFVAGNIIRDVQLSIVAAAEGASAAFGINRALTREDFERRATGVHRLEQTLIEDKH